MDQIQQVMLHYRDTEAITFFLCLGSRQAVVGAKADIGDMVHKTTVTWDMEADQVDDPTRGLMEIILEMVTEIRRDRREQAPPEPDVQLG